MVHYPSRAPSGTLDVLQRVEPGLGIGTVRKHLGPGKARLDRIGHLNIGGGECIPREDFPSSAFSIQPKWAVSSPSVNLPSILLAMALAIGLMKKGTGARVPRCNELQQEWQHRGAFCVVHPIGVVFFSLGRAKLTLPLDQVGQNRARFDNHLAIDLQERKPSKWVK